MNGKVSVYLVLIYKELKANAARYVVPNTLQKRMELRSKQL
jgi:hypothetical protein